jgi:hypothetical protein
LEPTKPWIVELDFTRMPLALRLGAGHADTIPGHWLPPFAGKRFIEHETRAQFEQLRDEMLRRKSSAVALAR